MEKSKTLEPIIRFHTSAAEKRAHFPTRRGRGISRNHDAYAIGYGRPPTSTQFRPGRSGNPKGRTKKGRANKDLIARETLEQKIAIKKDRRLRKKSLRRVAFQRIGEKASAVTLNRSTFSWPGN